VRIVHAPDGIVDRFDRALWLTPPFDMWMVTPWGPVAGDLFDLVKFEGTMDDRTGLHVATLTLQPDSTTGNDTWLARDQTGTNFSTHVGWVTGGKNPTTNEVRYKQIAKFDLSTLAGYTIVSATLTLYLYSSGDASAFTWKMNRILAGNSDWSATGACWAYRKLAPNTAWAGSDGCSTAGTDYAAATLWSGTPGTGTGAQTFILDAGEFQTMVAANYGFVFWMDGYGSGDYRFWRSADWTTAAERPQLVVEYRLPDLQIAGALDEISGYNGTLDEVIG